MVKFSVKSGRIMAHKNTQVISHDNQKTKMPKVCVLWMNDSRIHRNMKISRDNSAVNLGCCDWCDLSLNESGRISEQALSCYASWAIFFIIPIFCFVFEHETSYIIRVLEKSGKWSDIVQFGRWWDGVTALAQLYALYSDRARFFNQWQRALYPNLTINVNMICW